MNTMPGLSFASVVATAITESNCTNPAGSSDGLSSGPMQVTATTCAAVMGISASSCRRRMHTEPAFSFHGRYYDVEETVLEPKPVRRPRPTLGLGLQRAGAPSRLRRKA